MLHHQLLTRLCRARTLLRTADASALSVPGVARVIGISPYHFIRLYKSVFGETPNQCRIKARLDKAKRLLLVTDHSITRICLEVGYTSPGSFTTAFNRHLGMTPSAFRRVFTAQAPKRGQVPSSLVPGCLSLMPGSRQ